MKLTRRRIRKKTSRVKRQKLGRKTKNRRKSFRKKRTKGRRRRRNRRSRRGGAAKEKEEEGAAGAEEEEGEKRIDVDAVMAAIGKKRMSQPGYGANKTHTIDWDKMKKDRAKEEEAERAAKDEAERAAKEEAERAAKEEALRVKVEAAERYKNYYSANKRELVMRLERSKNKVLNGPDDNYPTLLGQYIERAELHNRGLKRKEENEDGTIEIVSYPDLKIDDGLIKNAENVLKNLMKKQAAEKEKRRSRSITVRAERAARGVKEGLGDIRAYLKEKINPSAKVGQKVE
jgi:hypothetical protein